MCTASRCRVYNSRNPEMLPSSRVRWAWSLLILCFFSRDMLASDWHLLTGQLSGKIAAVTGPGVIALDISNRSSISASEVSQIRRELESCLASYGVRIWQPEQAAGTIKVTLSESLQEYVWVAEIQQAANERSVVIISAPRPDTAVSAQNAPPLTLHAIRLVSQTEPILDAALIEGTPRRMLVLTGTAVTAYELKDGRWLAGPPLLINHSRPWPRDLRGRILLRKDHLFDAYLPGVVCRSTNATPLGMNCSQSDDPWLLEADDSSVSAFFAPARDFFTGALVPGIGQQKSTVPFYSAVTVRREKYALWVFAGVDGQLRLLDGINQQTLTKIHWGSDIAGVRDPCRQGSQVLATSSESGPQDSIQAFEFPDREPVSVSEKLELNGRVTALWTAQSGEGAVAVFRNSESGDYEAVLLNITCAQ